MKYLNFLTRYQKDKNSFLLIFFGFLLISCGGGSSSSGPGGGGGNITPLNLVTTGSVFIEFNFRALDDNNFDAIVLISIEYTTSETSADVEEYDFSVDSDNNDFTKDTPYNLENLVSNTTYYYRIRVYYADVETKEETGNFKTNSIDDNKDGLIEIGTLRQLYNMRYNLKGTSYKTDDSNASDDSGCPATGCFGYELTGNLDFDKNNSGSTWSTSDEGNNGTIEYTLDASDNAEPYFVVDSGGWIPIGKAQLPAGSTDSTCDDNGNNTCFDAVFDGKGYKITGLAMRRDLEYLGMFGATGASADIRNLGLVANLADYTGASNNAIHIGGLVGEQNGGSITTSYTTGNAAGGAGDEDRVGGLVGFQDGGSITDSYAEGNADGADGTSDIVGGLVGYQFKGSITASYATGNAAGAAGDKDSVGGLVGSQDAGGSIIASYATGNVDGGRDESDSVGGLVGSQDAGGSIIASYATGNVDGGRDESDSVGGLVGLQVNGGSITASYATGNADGGAGDDDRVGGLVGSQDAGGSITDSYATGAADGGDGDDDRVGGLVGEQNGGNITTSYATGSADGGVGNNDRVGGLVGLQESRGSITASYATGKADGGVGNNDRVGGLVGLQASRGSITASYATGKADGGVGNNDRVGGLVGEVNVNGGIITASYATGNADGGAGDDDRVGGLVGLQVNVNGGSALGNYGFGALSGGIKNDLGSGPSGILGSNDLTLENTPSSWHSITDNTFSAWGFGTNQPPILKYADYDGTTAGRKFACLGAANTATADTTIYLPYCGDFLPGQERSLGLDISSSGAKFGFNNLRDFTDITSIRIQYTTSDNSNYEFSVDSANDFTKDTSYTLVISPSRETYYYRIVVARGEEQEIFSGDFIIFLADVDNNGLIEIDSLTQLHNMRYNLKGTSYKTGRNMSGSTIGCPIDTGCFGYELTGNLDFDKNNSGSTWSTSDEGNNGTIEYTLDASDNAEPYFVVDSGGWIPIGKAQLPAGSTDSTCDDNGNNTCFDAVFDGKGYKITGLAMRRDLEYLGMFGATGASADIRNLGLVANLADYTGASNNAIHIGGLVGEQNGGSITTSYTTGNAAGGAGDEDRVGGLVGFQDGGSITDSYAEGNADGADGTSDIVGGLVGYQFKGSITASYATGNAAGAAGDKDSVGGLVGSQDAGGSIIASYATGNVDGGRDESDSVGGLVGLQVNGGSITASYATGSADGGAGDGDRVGGLVGSQDAGGSITASYATGNVDGGRDESDRVGGLVGSQDAGGSITASYATGSADGGAGDDDRVGGLVGSQDAGGNIIASYGFGALSGEIKNDLGSGPSGVLASNHLTSSNAGDSWDSTTDNTFSAWGFGTNQPPILKYADYDGTTAGSKFACLGAANTTTADTTIYLPYCGDFLPRQERSLGVDISSSGAKFGFNNLRDFTDITSIRIEYTTIDGGNYEPSVDTNNNDFTKDTPYTLVISPSRIIIYYYRIVVARDGEQEQEIFLGDFAIFIADVDNNGLIEIDSLPQLHNIRYNLKGTSYKTGRKSSGNTIGCPVATGCFGYELTGDLDFDKNNSGSTWSTSDEGNNGTIEYTLDASDNAEPYFVVNVDGSGGWEPIGDNTDSGDASFDATFDGKGYKITGLAMRRDLEYLGMFGATGASADIRNLGLVANLADYTGASSSIHIGGLVGRQDGGGITASYTTGVVDGGDGKNDSVGGLVGVSSGSIITTSYATGNAAGGAGMKDRVGGLVGQSSGSIITASYATGNAAGGVGNNDRVGGLVGLQIDGSITASYATGNADGEAGDYNHVGGLVGSQDEGGSIIASYATGNAAGADGVFDYVGGLVGEQSSGSITASYATGKADGGAGNNDRVGGLVGSRNRGGIITASYATGKADGGAGSGDRVGGLVGGRTTIGIKDSYSFGQTSNRETNGQGGKPSGVSGPKDLILSNAGGSWNSTTNDTFRAWDFTTDQPPALKYADYDGATAGKKFACEGAGNTTTDANTIYLPYCESFLPGQGRSPVGGPSATGVSTALGYSALVDNDFDGYIEISNLVALGNIIYNPQGTSYKTSTASKGITSGCPRGVCRGYELTRSFSTTELESGGVDHYLRNILTQDAVIKSNGYSIADIYF